MGIIYYLQQFGRKVCDFVEEVVSHLVSEGIRGPVRDPVLVES
jgi:hypothetical protein